MALTVVLLFKQKKSRRCASKVGRRVEKAGNAGEKNFHCITFSSQPAVIPSRYCVNNVTFQRKPFLLFRARLFTVENLSAASRNSKTF